MKNWLRELAQEWALPTALGLVVCGYLGMFNPVREATVRASEPNGGQQVTCSANILTLNETWLTVFLRQNPDRRIVAVSKGRGDKDCVVHEPVR